MAGGVTGVDRLWSYRGSGRGAALFGCRLAHRFAGSSRHSGVDSNRLVEGRNIRLEIRFAADPDQFQAFKSSLCNPRQSWRTRRRFTSRLLVQSNNSMVWASKPFWPCPICIRTRCPSISPLSPARASALAWTKTSFPPPSCPTKPNPLSAL